MVRNCSSVAVIVPEEKDRDTVHRVIYEELCLGKVVDQSRSEYLRIIGDLAAAGAAQERNIAPSNDPRARSRPR